jgi:hypothetical protein
MVPVVFSWTGSITNPSSTRFEMSNTARDMVHDMKTEASAKWKPAGVQIGISYWQSPIFAKQVPGQDLLSIECM